MSVSVPNLSPLAVKLFAQFAEILDDAVMHDRDAVGRVRMRVPLVRTAVRRPARVADAGRAGERLAFEPGFELLQLAFGAAALRCAVFERGDAGQIIAAIFEAPERVDQLPSDRLAPQYSDNPAHRLDVPLLTPIDARSQLYNALTR